MCVTEIAENPTYKIKIKTYSDQSNIDGMPQCNCYLKNQIKIHSFKLNSLLF